MEDDDDTFQLIRQSILFENEELLMDLLTANEHNSIMRDESGRSPLMLAAHNGKLLSLEILINMAPDTIDYTSPITGKTALHLASEAGQTSAVTLLLSAGADTSIIDSNGYCPLEVAHIAGHSTVASQLINAIQEEESRVESLHENLLLATVEGDVERVEEILIGKKNRDKILNGKKGKGALFVACENGRLECAQFLICPELKSIHILIDESSGDTLLHACITSQNILLLRLILETYPTLVSRSNKEGSSVLHWGVRSSNIDIVELLLEFPYPQYSLMQIDGYNGSYRFSFDVNSVDCECRTALYISVMQNECNILSYLLSITLTMDDSSRRCPFFIDVYCTKGRTPLMIAALNTNIQSINILLKHGSDVNLPLAVLDERETRAVGSGALLEATKSNSIEVVELLLSKGALDTDNRALRYSVDKKRDNITRLLLSRLAFPDGEYRVNKRNVEVGQIQLGQSLLPNSICPSKGVMLNWSSCNLDSILSEWISYASLHINNRLKTSHLSFAAITRVDLSNNKLGYFSPLLWQMSSLRILNVSGNELTTMEPPTSHLYSSNIESLIVKDNKITNISPVLLSLLPSLSLLDISNNDICQLPHTIWISQSLKELQASGNNISSLPSVYSSGRGDIDSQSISSRKTIDIPTDTNERIIRCSTWQNDIVLSEVEDNHPFLTYSHSLITLNLSYNKFRIFPTCIACTCPRLLNLSFSHNTMTTICSLTALPPTLRSLDVSSNELTQIFSPNVPMVDCHRRESIISDRRSSPNRQSRSRSKSAVRSQRALSITRNGDNMSNEICIHRRHSTLSHLKTLNLSNNKLSTLVLSKGDVILCPSLNTLDVSSNRMNELDGNLISKLSSLCVLSLSHNFLSSLPPQLGLLSRLWSLSLKGCPLTEPLHSILSNDNSKTVDIIAHLRSILEECKPYSCMRLFVLGESETGKTTLCDALRNEGKDSKNILQGKTARSFDVKLIWKKQNKAITFSVWDSNGESSYRPIQEYSYCRRGVYIIVFNVCHGDQSIHSISQFLISIQSRCPNACVILIGSHVDQLSSTSLHSNLLIDLESSIKAKFMSTNGDKEGFPRILDLLFVSLKKKSDIRSIISSIIHCALETRIGKELVINSNVPYSHLCLLNVLRELREERKKNGLSLIINQFELLQYTNDEIVKKLGRSLRDEGEIRSALNFVRDVGIIIRMEDSSLNQLIILDPLWFTDTLSLILSLRSTNRPIGIIPYNLLYTIKELSCLTSYILPLVHKYNVSVLCHSNLIILPSLLPDEYSLQADIHSRIVQIEAKILSSSPSPSHSLSISSSYHLILARLYSMTYIPTGLWSHILSRLTTDENISRVLSRLANATNKDIKWTMWQSGCELVLGNDRLVQLKQFLRHADPNEIDIDSLEYKMKMDNRWRPLNISLNQSILLYIPFCDNYETEEGKMWCSILSNIVDILDSLLEDWYPSIGTRFVHTSQGDLLVKRIVICPLCSPFNVPPNTKTCKDDIYLDDHHHISSITKRSFTMEEISSNDTQYISVFSIEECIEAWMNNNDSLICPLHGHINLSNISPDILFIDIDSSLHISNSSIKRGRLIGRGAFGFVFRSHIKNTTSIQPYEVAMKMLEPCSPGISARESAHNEYRIALSKWKRDSIEYSTRAYLSCRQEISLLCRLNHSNTLSLIGITNRPLSLIVDMAPLGSLRSLLNSFKKSAAKLSINTLSESTIQVSKALEYLHSNNIIYRDLKSENILAWRFPPPFCMGEVHLKLGDYGISRVSEPSGQLKGFGGTEGFMAPEIVKWNGEEEYSLKVDIFSFGMFLYELLTLKLPFESEEHVKERILDGGRPLIMPSELLWPCSVLDLLSLCWKTSPSDRPSSSQLVSLCCAPEFCHILDTMVISSVPSCILSIPFNDIDEDNDDGHIWMITPKGINVYSCTQYGWIQCTIVNMIDIHLIGRDISNDYIWRVDNKGNISLLSVNLSHSTSISIPIKMDESLISSPVPLSSSLLLISTTFSLHLLSPLDNSSYKLIESLTSPFEISSFTILNQYSNRQIWTGHKEGLITSHFISSDDKFSFSSSFNHPDGLSLQIGKLISSKDGSLVWSYLIGCSRVFCWDGIKRILVCSLDLSKVQPTSETIHTIQTNVSSHITSMVLLERGSSSYLFVGTKEGCLVVLSASSLQPLSACRPYEYNISTLHIVHCRNDEETEGSSGRTSSEGAFGWMKERVEKLRLSPSTLFNHSNQLLLSIGEGFRRLNDRFVTQKEPTHDIVAALWRIDDWSN